jgi:hypothetical protein
MALARHLAAEEGEGAAFMIAEVAMTVQDASPPLTDGTGPADVAREIAETVEALHELALAQPGPPDLQDYVLKVFAEAGR